MSKARLVITAVVVEGRTQAEVAADLRRLDQLGQQARGPLQRRGRGRVRTAVSAAPAPHRARSTPPSSTLIGQLRHKLAEAGLDAGPDTIAWHLARHHGAVVSRSTISRHLAKAGLVVPEPRKRPKSSYVRFEAAMPNQTWQSDFTHYRLTNPDGTPGHRCGDHQLARRLHPLRPARVRTPPGHRTDRAGHLPPNPDPAWDPGLHLDR